MENEKNSLQKSMLTEIFHVHHYAKKRNKKANYLMKRRYNHLREIDNYLMKNDNLVNKDFSISSKQHTRKHALKRIRTDRDRTIWK